MQGTAELHPLVFLLPALQYFRQSSFLREAFSLSSQRGEFQSLVPGWTNTVPASMTHSHFGRTIAARRKPHWCFRHNSVTTIESLTFETNHFNPCITRGETLCLPCVVRPWTKTCKCFKLCELRLNYRIHSWANGKEILLYCNVLLVIPVKAVGGKILEK